MCGRYQAGLTDLDMEQYRQAIKEIESMVTAPVPTREAFPSQELPIITHQGFTSANWGYPLDNKLVINARSETITSRRLFSQAIITSRCLIPAQSYYEWKQHKVKYQVETDDIMTMAGLILASDQGNRFVIITTDANQQIEPIHHRMPVLLKPEQLSAYLFDTASAIDMLKPFNGPLQLSALSPEQLSLFD